METALRYVESIAFEPFVDRAKALQQWPPLFEMLALSEYRLLPTGDVWEDLLPKIEGGYVDVLSLLYIDLVPVFPYLHINRQIPG